MNGKINHKGLIESIDGEHVKVRIVQSSACASCQAKSICSSSESKEKLIDIHTSESNKYHIGETVIVCASESMGRNAILLAFVTPLILMVACIVISVSYLSINEPISIGITLLVLILYYFCLSKNKERISKKFTFWIEKI